MKRNLLNFTRGSQLLGHFGFMFAAGLKGPLLVTFLVSAWLCYLEVTSTLTDHQVYLAWMHVYASGYAFMEFDPGKLVELKLAGGGTVRLPFYVVREFPPMREAVATATARVREGAPIGRSLGASRLFPPMTIHLISSGESSGELDTMLQRSAESQERELDGLLTALVGLLGPLLIVGMGVFVIGIVFAMLLPIFQMNSLIR